MKDVRVPENLQRAMAAEAEAARNARAKVFFMMVMIVMMVMMTIILVMMMMMAAEAESARNARAKVNCAFPFPDLLKRWFFLFSLHIEPEHNDDNIDYVDNNVDD